MNPYLDGGFLLVLLARTPGTRAASAIIRKVSPPVSINFLHQLQVENMLVRLQKDSDTALQSNGTEGMRLWTHYIQEGVFSMAPIDWESALRNAATWNRVCHEAPPSPWFFLHPAIAQTAGATHFCSFDPRPRAIAKAHGMALLPEQL